MAAIGQSQVRPATTIRTPLFIVGVALALLAFVAMFAVGIVFERGSQGAGQVRVVLATQDIQARQPITLDLVTMGSVASSSLPPKSLVRLGDVTSLFAVVPIYKGEVITANVVASNADQITGQDAFLPIPEGYVALTIPAGEQQAVAGFIAQGDFINVSARADLNLFSPNRKGSDVRQVFANVYVLRVGPQSAVPRQGQAQGVASSLTILMTQCDADYMIWLVSNTTLTYTLLSSTDYLKTTLKPDPSCPATTLAPNVTAAAVDARWGFTRG
jgi:Flp pilus assembly protein CpaB